MLSASNLKRKLIAKQLIKDAHKKDGCLEFSGYSGIFKYIHKKI
jgi:hypothetical protein